MASKSEDGASAINATSKPRGTYLDPLKACALSGESGVNIGKSESATYTKYMNIVRQTRRTASRVSVLNDVERSRLSSVMRRIDGEKAYSTAVMDRQKRQFKKSLENLDRHRSGLLRQIDEVVTTPSHLRAKQSMLLSRRQHQFRAVISAGDGGKNPDEATDQRTSTAADVLPKNEGAESRLRTDRSTTELPDVTSIPRTPYSLRARNGVKPHTVPSDNHEPRHRGENIPVFYTALGPDKLKDRLGMVHTKENAKKNKTVTM